MLISDIQLFLLSSHLFDIFLMLKNTIKIAYLCTHDYCVDIGKANHVFYNLERMIQKWKVGPKFSGGDHIFRNNWFENFGPRTIVGPKFSEGDHIFRKNWSAGTKIFKENFGL